MSDRSSGSYEFGPYRLNATKRLLRRGGQTIVLPPKPFDLLLLLLESDGRALTKDELMVALWPDTFVEESNLTFQISTLRKMLGDPAAGWIETIPKHGYRFVAPVAPLANLEGQQRRSWALSRRWWAGAVVLVIAVASVALLHVVRRPATRDAQLTAAPLTAYPGLELQPSLSPDGNQVALTWNGPNEDNFDIYVKLVGPGEPLRLTSDPLPEFSPSWSPDGRWIAFLRGPTNGLVGVYVIPALGGAERKIVDIVQPSAGYINRALLPNANLTWTPDGKWLGVVGIRNRDEPQALWLVSKDTGELHRLTEPPRDWAGDFGPAFSPDGRMLAFVRVRTLSISELHVLPLSPGFMPAGPPRKIAFEGSAIETPVWTADSREVVFSSGPFLAPRRLHRVSITGAASTPEILAIGEDATAASLSRSGRIVYARLLRDTNIWELDLHRPGSTPKRLIASTRDDYTPAYSPDGKRIAFASTRSGATEIWIANADGSSPTQVTNMGGQQADNPQWSPDGSTIVFTSRLAGSCDLYTLDPSTGQIRRLTDHPTEENEPRWSRDGKWIYFFSNRTGRNEVWKVSRDGHDFVQITHHGGITAQESPDGRYVYYSKFSPPSIWRVPAVGGEEVKIADELSFPENFDVAGRGIYFMASRGPKRTACIRFYDFSTQKITELLDTGKEWWIGIAVSPDGGRLLYSVVDFRGSDLMVADGIH